MRHRPTPLNKKDVAYAAFCVCIFVYMLVFFAMKDYCGADSVVTTRYDPYEFAVSVHNEGDDQVVSKFIRQNARYPSVDEMEKVCRIVNCYKGTVFVEVGSALGVVGLYAASRGMRVYAFDPLSPNIRKLRQSLCINMRRYCKNRAQCAFSLFSVSHSLVGASIQPARLVESEPGNLAATMRGGGSFRDNVTTTTIDLSVPENIELMLLTCQGFEYEALMGAREHIAAGRVRNIIWRRHYMGPEYDVKARMIVEFLLKKGYELFNIEGTSIIPLYSGAMEYVTQPRAFGEHPNVLASLGSNSFAVTDDA